MSQISEEKLERAAGLFRKAKYAVAFTGAGISTPSGIPDFRSNKSGLWEKENPNEVASLTVFNTKPETFFDWFRPLARTAFLAFPNQAHIALAKLEEAGIIKAVITQNIDNLHQRAGSTNVVEVHGTMNTFTCLSCGKHHRLSDIAGSFFDRDEIPFCEICRKPLKPDVILFEELLSMKAWADAEMHFEKADLVLVAGSSLEVTPANSLPVHAHRKGAILMINNLSDTFLDGYAEFVFHNNVVDTIPKLANLILNT